ncbi:hypothetical protein [Shewanella sp. MBTL60-007]|uniref:hypothetical protein n=1 Tax=Shewanella sp. MBTL60-007 TaxID=2815911 RepID=UPI001BB90056|nr:hypothetical protein [Shewanella sp. MBTL60-007]GIU32554.1 hypothetical protein TUM3792_45130 [Shewanella sp. MBTL60-007]
MSTNSNNGPQVNVDGTPMVADSGVDIKGNPYGVTESSIDTSCTTIDNSFNSPFDSSCGSSFDNSFGSSCDSSFDSFSSGFDDF